MSGEYNTNPVEFGGGAHYSIEVEGSLSESWADCLAGMQTRRHTRLNGSIFTTLSGRVMDQSELLGVLNSLYELHLPLLSLNVLNS